MINLDFLDQEPPPGYIAGIGRGATGFGTTNNFQISQNLPITTYEKIDDNNDDSNNGQFDDVSSGNYRQILSKTEQENIEADKIYNEVEQHLQNQRNKKLKRKNDDINDDDDETNDIDKNSLAYSLKEISNQFQDVKEELATISEEQWLNLPESGDFTRRNKRLRNELQQQQRFYRNSDRITLDLQNTGATDFSLSNDNEEIDNDTIKDDLKDNNNNNSVEVDSKVNLFELSLAKDRLLETQLRLGGKVTLSNDEIDKNTYLESLQETKNSQYKIGDYKKARKLFTKLRELNPHNPQNWIASAKLEFDAKKIKRAKELIQEGCELCPKSEDIWLTNLEINSNDIPTSKVIVADAIKYNYKSLKLWIKAVEFENDNTSKLRILRKALEFLPKSAELWMKIAETESDKLIAIKMLEKAITLIPSSIELLFKLSELQDSKTAIETLRNGVDNFPLTNQYLIWIQISKIEEKFSSNEVKIENYLKKSFESFKDENDINWFEQAENCEINGYPLTCRQIVLQTLQNCKESAESLIEKAKSYHHSNHPIISNALFFFVTSSYPSFVTGWEEWIIFKKESKEYKDLFITYEMAISTLPDNVDLYINYINDKIKYDFDLDQIKSTLSDALIKNPKSEKLWIYTIDFEMKHNKSIQIILDLLDDCLEAIFTPSVEFFLKKVSIEKRFVNNSMALKTLEKALNVYPKEPKVYLAKGDLILSGDNHHNVEEVYQQGIKLCDDKEKLYIALSSYHYKLNRNVIKARSILDEGLTKHPKSDLLYHSKIKLEMEVNKKDHALRLLAKGLSIIPTSPLLWCDNIKLATKQQIKNVYSSALKKTKDSPIVVLTIAKDLWKSGKIDRAYQFFKACLGQDDLYGDGYIFYYAFLLKFGSRDEMKELEELFNKKSKLHGSVWEEVCFTNERRNVSSLQLLREAAVDVSKTL
ncbi:U4/U6-U5 snRNP complex subunit [Pichia kluyveri]|uniref:U4/U6-U5 snRNP complex subunit n=1 Tax=Pichia kluyveri TaxID=36015 RepID=A0AAV5R094_PICKL|nr:U4/U6-U5 snRNP complex subunit [Pichia kluyveri]